MDEALAAISRQRRVVLTVNQFFYRGPGCVATTDLLTVLPRHFVGATGMEHELALCELPLQVPAVHVDSLWHRQATQNTAHRWLRHAIARARRHQLPPGHSHRRNPGETPPRPGRLKALADNGRMKLQLLSDLHLEANPDFVPAARTRGPTCSCSPAIVGSYQLRRDGSAMAESDWGLGRFAHWPVPVLFVPGNHRIRRARRR